MMPNKISELPLVGLDADDALGADPKSCCSLLDGEMTLWNIKRRTMTSAM